MGRAGCRQLASSSSSADSRLGASNDSSSSSSSCAMDSSRRRPSSLTSGNQKTPRPSLFSRQDERPRPPAVPPAFAACDRVARGALVDRVNGRFPDRFTDRSRVVRALLDRSGFQPLTRALCGLFALRVRPDRRFVFVAAEYTPPVRLAVPPHGSNGQEALEPVRSLAACSTPWQALAKLRPSCLSTWLLLPPGGISAQSTRCIARARVWLPFAVASTHGCAYNGTRVASQNRG